MARTNKSEIINSINDYEQRAMIKLFWIQDHTAASAHRELVKLLGNRAYKKRTVEYWFHRFNEGNGDIEEHRGGDHKSGPERDERINQIEEAFTQSRSWSLASLSAHTGIPHSTCHRIVTENLKMRKVHAKWVPHELTPALMEQRVLYSEANLRLYNQQKTRLNYTITIDETWMSLHKPPEQDQAKQWKKSGEKPPHVTKADRFGPKYMMILAMDITGICYYEILERNETES